MVQFYRAKARHCWDLRGSKDLKRLKGISVFYSFEDQRKDRRQAERRVIAGVGLFYVAIFVMHPQILSQALRCVTPVTARHRRRFGKKRKLQNAATGILFVPIRPAAATLSPLNLFCWNYRNKKYKNNSDIQDNCKHWQRKETFLCHYNLLTHSGAARMATPWSV